MTEFTVGIDPGVNGAIAVIKPDDSIHFCSPLPIIEKHPGNKKVDGVLLCQWLEAYKGARCAIEKAHTFSTDGIVGAFTYGHANGMCELACLINGLIPDFIAPATWKRKFGLIGKRKSDSVVVANGIFEVTLKRVKDHHMADALLIAKFVNLKAAENV